MTGTNRPVNITLTGSDYADACVDSPFTYSIVANPTHGTLTGTGANRTYTPNHNYEGVDSFTFTTGDGVWTSSPATVTLLLVAAPQLTAQCSLRSIWRNWNLDSVVQGMGLSLNNYQVYRSTTHGGPYTLIYTTPDSSQTMYVDASVAPGTTYYYVVTFSYQDPSTGTNYVSPYSNEASSSTCCPGDGAFWVDY